jgi:hypothetical protein
MATWLRALLMDAIAALPAIVTMGLVSVLVKRLSVLAKLHGVNPYPAISIPFVKQPCLTVP